MTDQRQSGRKIVKVKALVTLEGQPPLAGRTLDLSASGVCITVEHPLRVGQAGQLRFDLLVEGRLLPFAVRARVVYCIFGGGVFKAGFQFLNLDLATVTQLSRFLR